MTHFNRKRNFVDNSVQTALLKRIFLHWIIFFVIVGVSVVVLQTLLGDPGVSVAERLNGRFGEFVFMGLVMMALFPVFMLDTIRFSNQFVGPVTRFRRHLRQLVDGDTARCAFRGDDFWSEMAEEFNAVAEKLEIQEAEIARLSRLVDQPAAGRLGS